MADSLPAGRGLTAQTVPHTPRMNSSGIEVGKLAVGSVMIFELAWTSGGIVM